MTTETLSQTSERQKLQVMITDEAGARLRIAAALQRVTLGEIVSDLADKHLPPSPSEKIAVSS